MMRTLVLAASIAALSVPAFAGDITISLAGKTKAQVVTEIHNAAASVCESEGYHRLPDQIACMAEVEHQAMADLAVVQKKG